MSRLTIALVAVLGLALGCKHKSNDPLTKLSELKDRMCACKEGDKDCVAKVQQDLKALPSAELSDEDTERAKTLGSELGKCATKASTVAMAPAIGERPATAVGSGSAEKPVGLGPGELPKECGEWKAMIDKLSTCERMPEAQRKVMRDVYVEASKTWEGFPPENKPALAQSCKAGADAIQSSAKATCGW
jgi:hypothetical protein